MEASDPSQVSNASVPNTDAPAKPTTKTSKKKTTAPPTSKPAEPTSTVSVDDHTKRVSFSPNPPDSAPGPVVADKPNIPEPHVAPTALQPKQSAAAPTPGNVYRVPVLNVPTAEQFEQQRVQATPAVVGPAPTLEELRGATLQQMAQENRARSQSRVKQSMSATAARSAEKEARDALKQVRPDDNTRKAILCNQLNGYRDRFGTKIQFQWKKNYDPESMDEATLSATLTQVQILVNSISVPDILKNSVIGGIVEAVEILSLTQNWLPWLRLGGLKEQYDLQATNGVFDSEIDELVIKYRHLLQKPPEIRLGAKLAKLTTDIGIHNYKVNTANQLASRGGQRLANAFANNPDL